MSKLIVFLCVVLAVNGFAPANFALSEAGYQFEAANSVELLSTLTNVRDIIPCATICYRNSQCRTFDFDSSSKQCRLFEGSVDTGSLVANFLTTKVGSINISPSMYSFYNASSDQCVDNRFLDSETVSGRCECPIHTFWNGSMCLNQRFINDTCENNDWCRIDLLINCLAFQCVASPAPSYTSQTSLGGILFNVTNPTSSNYPTYTYYAYTWMATGSSATLSFFFRHDPGGWMLDDVSVFLGSTQMIVNGGFETGDLTGWTYSGTCYYYTGQAYPGSAYARSGYWYYYDRCSQYGDTISQMFPTTAGDTYNISFWLTNYYCCGTTEIANITLL